MLALQLFEALCLYSSCLTLWI